MSASLGKGLVIARVNSCPGKEVDHAPGYTTVDFRKGQIAQRIRSGCMSAFAGYAHGSKSSIGEPGDSVLECGGREALENGVPSREGQIMDGTTIELTEKLERLLREAAQVSVDLDRAKGTIVGVPHYSVIEARAHELGQQLSRQIQLRRMGEISAQASSSAKCPECGTRCELGRKKRRVTSIDGPLVVEEPVGHCPVCRRGFFPPSGNLGI